jgi:hypothetical protein
MKTKIFKLLILLFVVATLNSNADVKDAYHIRLTWVGNASVELILRNPKGSPISGLPYEDLDCYGGQPSPDWGVKDQDFDNPKWTETKIGDTNIQEIIAETLMDVGSYPIIARIINGEAECQIDKIRINNEDDDGTETETLNATDCNENNDVMVLIINTQKELLHSKVLKFKQNKQNNKFLIKLNYTSLPDEITTNDIARLYLNSEDAYSENNWESNKKKTKYFIDKPWTMKIIDKSGSQYIYIRGLAENYYKDTKVEATLFIGDFVGTNSFLTNKKAKYKYKFPK